MVRRIKNKNKTMNQATSFFIGIDVSKPFFDAALMAVVNHQKQPILTAHFDNTESGLKQFGKWLTVNKAIFEQTLLVMENTGIYHRLLWAWCNEKKIPVHIGNAAHIKWSFGIARGKNDRVDSIRLCQYACKEADTLKATPALNPALLQLKDLMTARTKLLSQLNSTRTYLKELNSVSSPDIAELMEQAHRQAIEGLKASVKQLEQKIKELIAAHPDLEARYKLLVTVPGIGHLTAVYLICCTNNFAGKINGKQLASYAGVVPFEQKSGTSVRGRNKVHSMANKELKKMLHLGALSAIRHNSELKDYYQRKKAEGKHSMSVLNAIRNKIALRAAAVINKQQPYQDYSKKIA